MTRWVALLPAHQVEAYSRAATGPGVLSSSTGADLPGSFGGTGATWDVTADRTPAAVAAGAGLPEPLDTVAVVPVRGRLAPLAAPA